MKIGNKEFYKNEHNVWCVTILGQEYQFPDGMCPIKLDDVADMIEAAYILGLREGLAAPDYSKIVERSAEIVGKEVKKVKAWIHGLDT